MHRGFPRLDGRTALVTGAGRGLGRACALALADAGARVIAVARTATDLESLVEEYGDRISAWVKDVTSDAFIGHLGALDRLDILVNNAGMNRPLPLAEVDTGTLDAMLDLNVRSVYRTSQAAAGVMLRRGDGGSIIHMSSQMGHVGSARRTVAPERKRSMARFRAIATSHVTALARAGSKLAALRQTVTKTSCSTSSASLRSFKI